METRNNARYVSMVSSLLMAGLFFLAVISNQMPAHAQQPSPQLQAQLPKLVFAPQWIPQAQFAGFYVAQDMGFYKEAGIDVEIIHPSASRQATSLLIDGQADVISLFLVTALSAKTGNASNSVDLVNIGQISQHSAIFILTKKSSGIDNLAGLDGKKIAVWKSGFDEVPRALMAGKGYKVEWVPILSSVNLFLMDGVDAMVVMSYNEYDYIINSGLNEDELNIFPVADFGYDIPEDGLYCLNSTYSKRKADLNKFLQATLRGWQYAGENKEYALECVLKRMKSAHIAANITHQEWMLDKVLAQMIVKGKTFKPGILLEADFNKAMEVLTGKATPLRKISFKEFYREPF